MSNTFFRRCRINHSQVKTRDSVFYLQSISTTISQKSGASPGIQRRKPPEGIFPGNSRKQGIFS
jgi:hypothetical protein